MNKKMISVSILLSVFIGGQAIAENRISDQEIRRRDTQTVEIHQKGRHIRRHVRQEIKREHRRLRHHRRHHLRHRKARHNIRITVE